MSNSKTLILLRGLPGAGKTELAKVLSSDKYPSYSVDDYFTDETTGKYEFEFSKNHLAYKRCEENVEKEMQNNTSKIFVHNTFTMEWEVKPYFLLAKKYDYKVFVATVENYHGTSNVHNVSNEQLLKMAEKYSVKLF